MKRRAFSEMQKRRERATFAALLLVAAMIVAVAVVVWVEADSSNSEEVVSSTSVPAGSVVSVNSTGSTTTTTPSSSASTSRRTTTSSTTTTTQYTHAISEPVRVVIPAIEVDAKLIGVGLLADGSLEVPPFGLAAWYNLGPVPGAPGPSVIVAHVDSKRGKDVFYDLKELEPGDEVRIYGSDGDVAIFEVDAKEQQLKAELPVDRIWNETEEPVIRLITCGGDFDRSSGHYLSNVIVYGHLVR